MTQNELNKLFIKLKKQQSETNIIEVKAANQGCPEKIYDTISAFSNQDDGGVILFGISENDSFNVVGVYDANDLQKKISSVCENMTPKIRPNISLLELNNKKVVALEIVGLDVELRPCYYNPRGKMAGSYIRVGDADELMTVSEIYAYDAYKSHARDDIRIIDGAEWKLLNEDRLNYYLKEVKRSRENLSKNVSDEEILELMGITKNKIPTLAGLLVFSNYPQCYFPNYTINAVVVPGENIGELGINGERFSNNKKITGSISDILDIALDFVYNNQKIKTVINEKGKRVDKPEYPILAIREAILNALVHRDYSKYSENMPITLVMYSNRLEITNPGGLFGRISIDKLGKVLPETRNAALADMLELLHLTENRYSGIPTMRMEMENLDLSDPEFRVERGTFRTIFYNTPINNDNEFSIYQKIYDFCKTPRTREEIIKMSNMSRYYVINKILKEMINDDKIGLINPLVPQSKNQKFYSK